MNFRRFNPNQVYDRFQSQQALLFFSTRRISTAAQPLHNLKAFVYPSIHMRGNSKNPARVAGWFKALGFGIGFLSKLAQARNTLSEFVTPR